MNKILTTIIGSLIVISCQNNSPNRTQTEIKDNLQRFLKQEQLHSELISLDSLFFNIAYNQCDSITGRKLISRDFEFYHDEGGMLLDSADVLASDIMVEDFSWICNGTYRKPVHDTFKVYPLYENEKLYGAIQVGDHEFYNKKDDQPTTLRKKAKFIHLWIIENDEWKLRRALSFDHH